MVIFQTLRPRTLTGTLVFAGCLIVVGGLVLVWVLNILDADVTNPAMMHTRENGEQPIASLSATGSPPNTVKLQQARQNEEWQMALKKIDELSARWPTYENPRLGIALRYPPHIKQGTVEFVEAGNIVFVTNSTSDLYAHRNDLPDGSEQEILDAAKKYMDGFASWAIVTGDAHSKADLSSFITNLKGCEIGPLGTTTQSEVYNVGVVPVKPGPPDDP